MKWTHTVEAVVDVETSQAKGQWKIGDAIAKDLAIAPGTITQKTYSECTNALETKGFDKYDPTYLSRLHRTAEAFSRSERDDRYSWDCHEQAGTPENLKQAATALRKLGKTITKYNVRWLMQEWREKAKAERQKANEAAKKEEAEAKREAAKAAERALKAKDKAAKDKARQERAAAKQKAKEAAERKKDSSTPAFNSDVNTDLQDESTLRAMAIYFAITLSAKKVTKEIEGALKNLDKIAEYLTPTQAAEIEHGYKQVIALAQQIVSVATRKPHLKVVPQGGAA